MVRALEAPQRGQILIPHEEEFQPLIAVRNTVIQASLGELREAGYFERYARNIVPALLREPTTFANPGVPNDRRAWARRKPC